MIHIYKWKLLLCASHLPWQGKTILGCCENITSYMITLFLTACVAGTYGNNCNNTCGNCLNADDCFHTNGTCLTGCDPGYTGALCKTRKKIDLFLNLWWLKYIYIKTEGWHPFRWKWSDEQRHFDKQSFEFCD